MREHKNKFILFNVAAGALVIGAIAGVVRSFVIPNEVAACSARYSTITQLTLEQNGQLLTAADLQARLGGADYGVLENVSIRALKDGPATQAVGIALRKGGAAPWSEADHKGGVSFPWQPRSARSLESACLSYSVFLPKDFAFHRGGTLPGLIGGQPESPQTAHLPEVSARIRWRSTGEGDVVLHTADAQDQVFGGGERFVFPRGRWVKLDQEIVLNTPKKADGRLRLWVDGTLVVDAAELEIRPAADLRLSGVAAQAYYGTTEATTAAPQDTSIWMTPFELRYN
jgi:hypothetical protein